MCIALVIGNFLFFLAACVDHSFDFISLLDELNDVNQKHGKRNVSDLVMMDHSRAINNGVILMRNTEWTRSFVSEWITLSERFPRCSLKDNGAMYLAILSSLDTFGYHYDYGNGGYDKCEGFMERCGAICEGSSSDFLDCFRQGLSCYGFEFGNRESMGHFAMLNPNGKVRFNQWFFPKDPPENDWDEVDYYRKGDPLVHSPYLSLFLHSNSNK